MTIIATDITASTIDDLSPDAWRIVARQSCVARPAEWAWTLPADDVAAVFAARKAGRMLTVQRRDMREYVLLAKWAKIGRLA